MRETPSNLTCLRDYWLHVLKVGVTRFMDSSSVMEAERELLTKIIQDHKPSLEEQPGLPLFLTSGMLIELVYIPKGIWNFLYFLKDELLVNCNQVNVFQKSVQKFFLYTVVLYSYLYFFKFEDMLRIFWKCVAPESRTICYNRLTCAWHCLLLSRKLGPDQRSVRRDERKYGSLHWFAWSGSSNEFSHLQRYGCLSMASQ